jgi:Tat protein translocase TatB subunit
MFDIGGWEFLVIVVVGLIVIGPKDLPAAVKVISGWVAKARDLAREFRGGLDELAREVELDKIENEVRTSLAADDVEQSVNSIRKDIEDAGSDLKRSADPNLRTLDEYEEAYTYFEETDGLSDNEEEEARKRAVQSAEADIVSGRVTEAPRDDGADEAPAAGTPAAAEGKTGA